ncbi:MAG: carotenoid biosynthesis protein [Candidatus Thorarchaeota archaeon]
MSKIVGVTLTLLFGFLAGLTSSYLWNGYSYLVLFQTVAILLGAALGEHIVSGKGYYHYTNRNGLFVGRVPVWIPLMWVATVQGTLILSLLIGLQSVEAVLLSGIVCASLDFYLIEPLASRKLGMWRWTSVDSGYFGFIPTQVNRFTAPAGNYLTWLFFPMLLNWFLGCMVILQLML